MLPIYSYLMAYTIPLSAFLGFYLGGPFYYLTPLYTFGIIPLLELLLPSNNQAIPAAVEQTRAQQKLFDWLLYLNVPLIIQIIAFAIWQANSQELSTNEYIGLTISLGIVLGSNGINVGHELGHRTQTWERFLGKFLLLPSHYMHFYIEHNFGHHATVATPDDPASARYNETVFQFWIRSIFGQYVHAWKLQMQLLQQQDLSFLSVKNDMLWYSLIQLIYVFSLWYFLPFASFTMVFCAGIVGILLLETINYIEHYGLKRLTTESGRYERQKEIHSWNSNHIMGRTVLFDLTRHSDHHFKSYKPYQILNYYYSSPELPYGYPTCMLLSTIPPLWFKIMNKRIPKSMLV